MDIHPPLSLQLTPYDLPLFPNTLKRRRRKGVILELTTENGKKGYADVAECRYSSLSFALESAYEQTTNDIPNTNLQITALVLHEKDAEKAYGQGYRTFKVKKPSTSFLKHLRVTYPEVSLRVDFNQSLSLKEAKNIIRHFSPEEFSYLEEPLQNFSDLTSLFPFPIAVDESLYLYPLDRIISLPNLKAIVVKPTLFGGYSRCKQLQKRGIDIILSSYYESGLGLLNIAQLAISLHIQEPLGIDTYRFLQKDILQKPLPITYGILSYQRGSYQLASRYSS